MKIPTTSSGSGGSGTTTYTVQKGDSLWSIANQFGVTVDALRQANNLSSDTLQIGQILKIPTTSSGSSGSGTTTYIVQSGDSLWSIANRYGITVDALKAANNLTSNTLSIGQKLLIPNSGNNENNGSANDNLTYTVQRGDSLWSIAKNFGITVDELKLANNLLSNTLSVGQILIIPTTSLDSNNITTYIVQAGDSLWLIASRYNTTVDEIKRLNNLSSNILQIGQELLIPTTF